MIDTSKNKFDKNKETVQRPDNLLVLSIDGNGKISYVNKECERIIGYLRREVVDKNFDLLIPDRHYDQWKKLFDAVKNDKQINDFRLPWLRRNGEEILAKWSIAPIGKEDGSISNIGLVGEIITNDKTNYANNSLEKTKNTSDKSDKKDEVVYQYGNKRIIFKSDEENKPNIKKEKPKLNISEIKNKEKNKINKKSKNKKQKNKLKKPLSKTKEDKKTETNDMDYKKVMKKYDSKKLQKKYEEFNENVRSIQKLKKENKNLEKKNKKLDKKLRKAAKKDKTKNEKAKKDFLKTPEKIKKISSNIIEIIGIDKKRQEFKKMIEELDQRKKSLKDLEKQLNNEKKQVNRSREEFIKWREKLEMLENEVEKRRIDLVKQEEKFENKLADSLKNNVCVKKDIGPSSINSETSEFTKEGNQHEVIDKIPQGAVIIQRGILKQINQPFSELIGYKSDDLIEKSLFDFIPPEGLSGFERYFLDRLKGEESSSYDTLFLTNDKKVISVEVNIKPMSYNGEKADMIVVSSMGEKTNIDGINNQSDMAVVEDDKFPTDNSTSDSGSKMNQDQISAMFDQVRDGKDASDIKNEEPVKKQGGVPGVVTQDQIDEMVKKARNETSEDNDKKQSEGKKPEEQSSSSGGKLSQDEINKMLEKNKDKQKDDNSKEKPDENKKPEEQSSSSGGKMGQSDINDLVKKMKKEKK